MSYQTSYDPVSLRWSLSDGSHYLELPEWAREILADEHERETKQLKTENAMLRDLCAELYAEMLTYSNAPTYNASVWSAKLRELRVEVDA